MKLYRHLAWDGIRKNSRLYVPYLLTGVGAVSFFYILVALARLPELHAAEAVEFLQAHPGSLTLALARAALVRGDQIRPAQLLPAEDGGMKLAG